MLDLGLAGRRALVNGGGSGLGLASARALASRGAAVALFGREGPALRRAASEMEALALPGEAASREQIEGALREAERALGGVDILINAAPVRSEPAPLHEIADAVWERAASEHVLAYLRFMRAATPGMRARGHGRVLNVTGVSARNPDPRRLPESTAALAVLNLTKATADELAPFGVTVNALSPGDFDGGDLDGGDLDGGDGDGAGGGGDAGPGSWIPAGRPGAPAEFADLVLFLCSERAGYVTGASIAVDGGQARGI